MAGGDVARPEGAEDHEEHGADSHGDPADDEADEKADDPDGKADGPQARRGLLLLPVAFFGFHPARLPFVSSVV